MAMEVLPTPGGPTRQMICPLASGFICRTAMNSRIRSFTVQRDHIIREQIRLLQQELGEDEDTELTEYRMKIW